MGKNTHRLKEDKKVYRPNNNVSELPLKKFYVIDHRQTVVEERVRILTADELEEFFGITYRQLYCLYINKDRRVSIAFTILTENKYNKLNKNQ